MAKPDINALQDALLASMEKTRCSSRERAEAEGYFTVDRLTERHNKNKGTSVADRTLRDWLTAAYKSGDYERILLSEKGHPWAYRLKKK